jgi:hypothetical protein
MPLFKMRRLIVTLCGICIYTIAFGQATVSFESSDKALETAFNWAKKTALSYKGDQQDPVGPWCEAALPSRDAFCMRDVSHQCIGAEILGMSPENRNMMGKFVSNISKSKNWCSYWEINKWDKPAPADYKNDREFWYNLNANFDLIYACQRLYNWTGDKTYINDSVFINFFEKSLNEYIKDWVLDPDSLLTRPSLPNSPLSIDKNDLYQKSRGLASYVENIPDLKMSADLIAAIFQGFTSCSTILKENGNNTRTNYYEQMASKYKNHLDSKWWDETAKKYHSYFLNNGKFGNVEGGNLFLLWFDAASERAKKEAIIQELVSSDLNVETMSYLPYLLYLNGYPGPAYNYILHLSNPATKRREYPEVSFGIIEGIIHGLMGIEPDAHSGTISTIFREKDQVELKADDLPVLNSRISVQHSGSDKTSVKNKGSFPIKWTAGFAGKHSTIQIDGKSVQASYGTSKDNTVFSFVCVTLQAGQQMNASVR